MKMCMKTIILANAPINNGNRGCVALSYCAMYLIDSILGKGNYELYLTDSFESAGMHTISLIGNNVTYESLTLPNIHTIKGLIKMAQNFRQKLYALKISKRADVILDIGQGDSFADIYGERRYKNIDRIHCIARLFKKQYAFLPQTIGPFKNEKIKKTANNSIRNSACVMTRDKQSYDYVVQNVPEQKNVKEYIDVAFFLPYKKEHFDGTRIHVGLNISALLWYGGYTKDNQFGLKCDYQKTIRGIINYFLSLDDIVLHLIPHVVLQERDIENDYAVSFDLCEEYKNERLVLAPFFLSPIDAKSYISGMDFFMGARMHATIAAFSSGVPVVPMAYSRKFNGLFIDTLGYDCIVDMKKSTDSEILSTIQNVYNKRTSVYELIQSINDGVVSQRKNELLTTLESILLK